MTPEVKAEMQRRLLEVKKCRDSLPYFMNTYCKILASGDRAGAWIAFTLWPAQIEIAEAMEKHREIVLLKSRQIGCSWIAVALILQRMLFHPIQTVLLFSRSDDEAMELLGFRLREMLRRLPPWLQEALVVDNEHEITLANGSRAMSFSTAGGRSYSGTICLVDEADYIADLEGLLNAAAPTVDNGGKLILLSTPDKSQPQSRFKRIYLAAKKGENSFFPIFYGWRAAIWRDDAWYQAKKKATMSETGSLDNLYQEFPEDDIQALSPRELDKRIPGEWLRQCYVEMKSIQPPDAPAIPGLTIYVKPRLDRQYVCGADTSEGNPNSDPSAATFMDAATGEEVAVLTGRFEPTVFAAHIYSIAIYYNRAKVLCERNNHGHLVIARLADFGVNLLFGRDGKYGHLSSTLGKVSMYDAGADAFKNKEVTLHSLNTLTQLSSIDGSSLRAPSNQHDDLADSFVLACVARLQMPSSGAEPCILSPARDLFSEGWGAPGGHVGTGGDIPPGWF